MVFHSPCLHCSLFISIYISCSIFSTHHSYTFHQQFDIIHLFSFIIDIFILDSFFITNIFILDVLRSMFYEILYTYYILHMRVWILIIGYLSLVSFHFFHPITLANVTSRVLRPPWGHDIMHCVLIALTWAISEIGRRTFWLWWTKSYGMTLHLGHSHFKEFLSGM